MLEILDHIPVLGIACRWIKQVAQGWVKYQEHIEDKIKQIETDFLARLPKHHRAIAHRGFVCQLLEARILSLKKSHLILRALNEIEQCLGYWPLSTPKNFFRVGGPDPKRDKWNGTRLAHFGHWLFHSRRWYSRLYKRLLGDKYKPFRTPKWALLMGTEDFENVFYDPEAFFLEASKQERYSIHNYEYLDELQVTSSLFSKTSGWTSCAGYAGVNEVLWLRLTQHDSRLGQAWINSNNGDLPSAEVVRSLSLVPQDFEDTECRAIYRICTKYLNLRSCPSPIIDLTACGICDLQSNEAVVVCIKEIAKQIGYFPLSRGKLNEVVQFGIRNFFEIAPNFRYQTNYDTMTLDEEKLQRFIASD